MRSSALRRVAACAGRGAQRLHGGGMPHMRRGQQDYQELLLRAGGGLRPDGRRVRGRRGTCRHLSAKLWLSTAPMPSPRCEQAHTLPRAQTHARRPGQLDSQTSCTRKLCARSPPFRTACGARVLQCLSRESTALSSVRDPVPERARRPRRPAARAARRAPGRGARGAGPVGRRGGM